MAVYSSTQEGKDLRLAWLANKLEWLLFDCYQGEKKQLERRDIDIVRDGLRYFNVIQEGIQHDRRWQEQGVATLSRKTLESWDAFDRVREVLDPTNVNEIEAVLSLVLEYKNNLEELVQKEKAMLERMRNLFHELLEYANRNPIYPEADRSF